MATIERLIGMTHDVLGKVRRLRRPARGNVVWFGGRLWNVAISAPDLNQEWSCSLPHLRVSIFVFLLRAFVAGPARQSRSIEQTHLEAASIILSPNKSYPPPNAPSAPPSIRKVFRVPRDVRRAVRTPQRQPPRVRRRPPAGRQASSPAIGFRSPDNERPHRVPSRSSCARFKVASRRFLLRG
jgi:hypothetical protein